MRYCFFIYLLFICGLSKAQYKGGIGDGVSFVLNTNQNTIPAIYTGGNSDGFSQTSTVNQNILPTIYTGGISDGFTQTSTLNQNILPTIYTGGISDGFSQTNTLNQNALPTIYSGGIGDGFTQTATLNQNTLPVIYTGGVGDGFSTITVFNQNRLGVLALRLELFTGNWDNNQKDVKLNWATFNETGINDFEIERSINNGASYTKVFQQRGNGGTNASVHYTYIDVNAADLNTNTILYRLKIIENNSTIRYSGVIRLSLTNKKEVILIYPNPTSGVFTIDINKAGTSSNYNYQIYDTKGRLIKTDKLLNIKNQVTIYNQPIGNYILAILDNNGKLLFTTKIMLTK